MADGNRHLGFKEVLNALEERSPGTKAAFLTGFLERAHERFDDAEQHQERDRPATVQPLRLADPRRALRVLPAPGTGAAGRAGPGRADSRADAT